MLEMGPTVMSQLAFSMCPGAPGTGKDPAVQLQFSPPGSIHRRFHSWGSVSVNLALSTTATGGRTQKCRWEGCVPEQVHAGPGSWKELRRLRDPTHPGPWQKTWPRGF